MEWFCSEICVILRSFESRCWFWIDQWELSFQSSSSFSFNSCLKRWKVAFESGLVKPSAAWLFVGMYSNRTLPAATCSRIKWCRMCMCLVRAWSSGFLLRFIAPSLSANRIVGHDCLIVSSSNSCWNHSSSCTASDSAMYSASVLDRATVACFFVIQEIGPKAMIVWESWRLQEAMIMFEIDVLELEIVQRLPITHLIRWALSVWFE